MDGVGVAAVDDKHVTEKEEEELKVEGTPIVGIPKETLDFFNGDEIRARVFYEKYALKDEKGRVLEKLPAEMWERISHELASVETDDAKRSEWHEKFMWLLKDFRFVPGGRIMFGAGARKRATLLNCLRGDTQVLIKKTVDAVTPILGYNNKLLLQGIEHLNTVESVNIKNLVGQAVEVLTPKGWSTVTFRNFGRQTLYKVKLKNGDVLFATANHDWVIRSNKRLVKKTTVELMNYKGGNGLVVNLPDKPKKDSKYYDGVIHGIVYGDGTKNYAGTTYSVWLFGAQRELAKYLPKVHEYGGNNDTLKGALLGSGIRSVYDLKKLPPTSETSSYWYGFISGYIGTDGWMDTRGVSAGIDSHNKKDLEIIKTQLGRVGLIGNDIFTCREYSPYSGAPAPLYRLGFWKASLSEDLFLRSDHLAKFGKSKGPQKRYTIGIESIEETNIEEDVYCCDEPKTHTFVLGNGILTGNCYVIPIKEDSLEAIFDWCKEAARTYSLGGGVGSDITLLRPRGAPVNNSAVFSSGAVSFMEIMSETTHTIGQNGRRGALMITISVDHPDVIEFIKVKQNLKKVRYANISIRITDEFMRAVEGDTDFTLRFDSKKTGKIERVVKARLLWNELIKAARDWAEPGLIFWDTVKKYSPSEYNGMEVITTNPCSEQPLQPYGACDLGSINLSAFVLDSFTDNARTDWAGLEKATRYAMRFLDNVLDYNADRHPLKEQAEAVSKSRRTGLGVTGLGDMLAKLRIKYDSDESLAFVDKLFSAIENAAYDESTEIAKEKGPFPLFDREKHLSMPFVRTLNESIRQKISDNGLRNVALLTIPPVGSGSVLAGTSSGIEPIFAFSYTRRSESLSKEFFRVYHPLVLDYMQVAGLKDDAKLPDFFVPAHKIKAEFRVKLQGIIQKHIDSAISSTVNLPENTSVEQVGDIYMMAWKAGAKGITVYREGSREGILISDEEEKKKEAAKAQLESGWKRPQALVGKTVKLKMQQTSLYVTANFDEEGKIREVFVNMGHTGSQEKSYTEAIGRLISRYVQLNGDLSDVIQSLKGIKANDAITWDRGIKLYSVPDAIAKALEIALGSASFKAMPLDKKSGEDPGAGYQLSVGAKTEGEIKPETCPECSEPALVHESGCYTCRNCGYTKCA